jgi:Spx/MgsR family transcriptional regulator
MSTTPTTVTLYGIPNCDTVKKARNWLAEHHVEVQFHDFKKLGMPDEAVLSAWFEAHPWDTVINKKGTTWRKLEANVQAVVVDKASAKALAAQTPSVVKRPIVRWPNGQITVGFAANEWESLLPYN